MPFTVTVTTVLLASAGIPVSTPVRVTVAAPASVLFSTLSAVIASMLNTVVVVLGGVKSMLKLPVSVPTLPALSVAVTVIG